MANPLGIKAPTNVKHIDFNSRADARDAHPSSGHASVPGDVAQCLTRGLGKGVDHGWREREVGDSRDERDGKAGGVQGEERLA